MRFYVHAPIVPLMPSSPLVPLYPWIECNGLYFLYMFCNMRKPCRRSTGTHTGVNELILSMRVYIIRNTY